MDEKDLMNFCRVLETLRGFPVAYPNTRLSGGYAIKEKEEKTHFFANGGFKDPRQLKEGEFSDGIVFTDGTVVERNDDLEVSPLHFLVERDFQIVDHLQGEIPEVDLEEVREFYLLFQEEIESLLS